MATTIRDVVVRINIEQAQAALKAPDLTGVQSAIDAFQQTLIDGANSLKVTWEQAGETVVDAGRKIDGSGRPVINTTQEMVDTNMKLLDSLKAAGEGAFTLARGIAFLSASSDKDFQKTLQSIARVQGAFDAFKGGIETIKGIVEATKVMSAALQATTATTTALTAATQAQTAASVAMNAAMGPIGIAVAAVAAAIALMAIAMRDSGETAEEAAGKWASAADRVALLQESANASRRSIEDETLSMRSQEQQLEKLQARRKDLGREINNAQQRAERGRTAFVASVTGEDTARTAAAAAEELAAAKDIDTLIEQRKQSEKEIASIKADQAQKAIDDAKQQQEALRTIKERLAVEEKRLQTADAQFAAMDAMSRRELENLAEVARQRKLTREELLRVQSLGGSAVGEYVNKGLSEIGQGMGSRDVLSAFGVDAEKNKLKAQQDALAKQAGAGSGEDPDMVIQKRIEKMIEDRQKALTRTADLIESFAAMEANNDRRIARVEAEFKQRRNAL